MMDKVTITRALAVTQKICGGGEIAKDVVKAYLAHLEDYEDAAIIGALTRCQAEVRGHVALADIMRRLPSPWPAADAAWAMCPRSEAETVVWTGEAAAAYDEVSGLGDDRVAQRMAFKAAYERMVIEARAGGVRAPSYFVSLGTDRTRREGPVLAAVQRGLITEGDAKRSLPLLNLVSSDAPRLPGPREPVKALPSGERGGEPATPEEIRELLKGLNLSEPGTA